MIHITHKQPIDIGIQISISTDIGKRKSLQLLVSLYFYRIKNVKVLSILTVTWICDVTYIYA